MRHRTTSYDKSYVGSSGTALKSDNVRKSAPQPSKVTRAAELRARYLRRAMRCGLSRDEALSMLRIDYGMARKIVRHPEQAAAVVARAAVAIEAVVLVVNARRARRAA